ncbi:MAG: hypothetical protein WBC42_10500, partial [Candidatus Zixiibacteriota bacterium]
MKLVLPLLISVIIAFSTLLPIEVKADSDNVLGDITSNGRFTREKATYYDPTGTLDTIQNFIAYGWTYDPDVPS